MLRRNIRCARVPAVERDHQDVLDQYEEGNDDKCLRLEPLELILLYHDQQNKQQLQEHVYGREHEQRVF